MESGWHKYLKEEYWPDINNRSYIDDIATSMIDYSKVNSTYDIAPSISPDGKKIAYYSNQDGLMSICIISSDCEECDKKSIKPLLKGGMSIEFEELHILKPGISWSKNSDSIILSSSSKGVDVLYIIDINTKKKRKIVFDNPSLNAISQPIWNPVNNEMIAFVGSSNSQSDIYLYNLKSDKTTQLTDDIFTVKEISWSNCFGLLLKKMASI